MMLQKHVAPGIHRVETAFTNWYLVEEGSHVTVVDTGLPRSWGALQSALAAIGREPSDIDAVVLTHAHYDHVGFAERARTEWHVPVWVHERDATLARHPLNYEHERSMLRYARYPKANVILGALVANGMLLTRGVGEVRAFAEEEELAVPGRPRPVFTPGHTHGHTALHFPDRGALITGDALVTLNPYTGATGPRIVAAAANVSSTDALASLQRFRELDAAVLLPGHGKPWTDGVEAAVERAIDAGPS